MSDQMPRHHLLLVVALSGWLVGFTRESKSLVAHRQRLDPGRRVGAAFIAGVAANVWLRVFI